MITTKLGRRCSWREGGTDHHGHELQFYWGDAITWGDFRVFVQRDGDSLPVIVDTRGLQFPSEATQNAFKQEHSTQRATPSPTASIAGTLTGTIATMGRVAHIEAGSYRTGKPTLGNQAMQR